MCFKLVLLIAPLFDHQSPPLTGPTLARERENLEGCLLALLTVGGILPTYCVTEL